jgi:hypothetical protein
METSLWYFYLLWIEKYIHKCVSVRSVVLVVLFVFLYFLYHIITK